jgi:putative ABC transport system permease protein
VRRVAPLAVGTSEISFGGRLREVMVAGSTTDFLPIRNFELAQGAGLPDDDWSRGAAVAIIGAKIRDELFGSEPAVGS